MPAYYRQVSLSLTLARKAQIVVGVLVKYVNLGKGWRHRLFVLQNGVLRYYKVRCPGNHHPCHAYICYTLW